MNPSTIVILLTSFVLVLSVLLIMLVICTFSSSSTRRLDRIRRRRNPIPRPSLESQPSKTPPPDFRQSQLDPIVFDLFPPGDLPTFPDNSLMVEVVRSRGPSSLGIGRVEQPPDYTVAAVISSPLPSVHH